MLGKLISHLFQSGREKEIANDNNKRKESKTKSGRSFAGISLRKWNELAKEVYRGKYCSIDEYGFLVFHYTSPSGKTHYDVQMSMEKGKLVHHAGYYPGQTSSSADRFARLANERFFK